MWAQRLNEAFIDDNIAHFEQEAKMLKLSGSCHCGDVKFSIRQEIVEATTCDCSLCVKKNAVMIRVHEDGFSLITPWENLSEYRWNTHIARHYFCRNCGIYTFHRKRALPDHFGVNIYCLDGFDAASLNVRPTEGASMSLEIENPRAEWLDPSQ
jgi:hypothetical protein